MIMTLPCCRVLCRSLLKLWLLQLSPYYNIYLIICNDRATRYIHSLGGFCLLIMCFFHSCVQTQDSSLLSPFSIPLPIPALRAVFLSNHQLIAFSCFLSESPKFLWMCWNLCPGQADCAVVCAFWWSLETSGFTAEIQTRMPLNAQMDWN